MKKEILIYDEAGMLPIKENPELSKKIKKILERNNPSRRLIKKGRKGK